MQEEAFDRGSSAAQRGVQRTGAGTSGKRGSKCRDERNDELVLHEIGLRYLVARKIHA